MVQTVPYVQIELRIERYEEAVEAYINGDIGEFELEAEIEAAMEGQVEYDRILKQPELIPPDNSIVGSGKFQYMGVDLEPGEEVVGEDPDPLDVDSTDAGFERNGPILGGQTVQ